jgi:hypothetical protein
VLKAEALKKKRKEMLVLSWALVPTPLVGIVGLLVMTIVIGIVEAMCQGAAERERKRAAA